MYRPRSGLPDLPHAADLPRLSTPRHHAAPDVIPDPITTILFDAGDTLIAYRRPLRILLQDFFIAQNEILRRDAIAEALEAVNPRYRSLVEHIRTVEEERRMWIELARDLLDVLLPRRRDLYPQLAHWFSEAWKHLKVFRDVGPTLRKLRARGYRLAVVANWEPSLPTTLEKLGLRRHFETVVASAAEGIWKPDPRLFQIALARLDVPPHVALSVGDHVERDVEAARAAGLHGLLLDRFDDYPKFTPRVRTLAGLLEWLGIGESAPGPT